MLSRGRKHYEHFVALSAIVTGGAKKIGTILAVTLQGRGAKVRGLG